ncbi:MAG TPA: hypothetical protein VM029_02160 [Opitutaceae bacterium]|nr:hypothetical protein [Opitutaceae bacterium]
MHRMLIAATALAITAQAQEPAFIYHCKGSSRILPSGLAMGTADWKWEIQPAKKVAVFPDGTSAPIEIDQYRVSFPLEGKHGISITRANGRFYAVKPIDNPKSKLQEYLLYEGECKRGP